MLTKASSEPLVQFTPPREQAPIASGSAGHDHPEAGSHDPPLVLITTEVVDRDHGVQGSTVRLQDERDVSPTELPLAPIEGGHKDGGIVEREASFPLLDGGEINFQFEVSNIRHFGWLHQ
jgi:hypothetical protein